MKRTVFLILILCITFTIVAETAYDSDQMEVINLGETVVTAERVETNKEETTKNVQVLNSDDLEKASPATIFEALEMIPGITVKDWTSNGKSGGIDAKGMGETAISNTVILVDGIKINSIDLSGPNWGVISLDNIKRIEYVSSGGVQYGDGAVGGIINIITKLNKKDGLNINFSETLASYSSNNYSGSIGYKNEQFDLSFAADSKNTDGYRDNSYYNSNNYTLNLFYTDSLLGTISGKYNTYEDDYGLPGSLSFEDMNSNRTKTNSPNDKGETEEDLYQINHNIDLFSFLNLSNTYSFNSKDINSTMYAMKSEVEQKTVNSKLKASYLEKSYLLIGYDYIVGEVETKYGMGLPTVNKKNTDAFYLYNKSSYNKFNFTEGYRKEKNKFKRTSLYTSEIAGEMTMIESVSKKDFTNEALEFGLSYELKNTNAYLNYSQNFRAPNTDEQYNPGLKPQTGESIELGFRGVYHEIVSFDFVVFNTSIADEIFYNPKSKFGTTWYQDGDGNWLSTAGYEGANQNINGKTNRLGLNLYLKEYLNFVELSQNISFVNPIIKNYKLATNEINEEGNTIYKNLKDKTIPAVPKLTVTLAVEREIIKDLNVKIDFNYIGKQYAISDWENNLEKLEDYSVLNSSLRYKKGDLTFTGKINNILNKKYSEYVVSYNGVNSYYPSPERNYSIGVKYSY